MQKLSSKKISGVMEEKTKWEGSAQEGVWWFVDQAVGWCSVVLRAYADDVNVTIIYIVCIKSHRLSEYEK